MAVSSASSVECEVAKRIHHCSAKEAVSSSPNLAKDGCQFSRYHDAPLSIDEVLPGAILGEILSRLNDSRDLAHAACVSTAFRTNSAYVKFLRILCRLQDVQSRGRLLPFKDIVLRTLENLKCVECLRLEIEDGMQAKKFKEEVPERNSYWLSEQSFVLQWLPKVSERLESLTIIDYGQQAIFQPTPLLQLLSTQCRQLKTLELRNMFLDCKVCEKMEGVTKLTLRCVKLSDNGLKDLNDCMPRLDTLTLVTVVGLKQAKFSSDCLKVLCLGLATKVKNVTLEVKSLVKLQLKMACPDELKVTAPNLKCLALCMDKRENARVEFREVKQLEELLMGASEFSTLTQLSSVNVELEKVFLDVPCMSFEDSGGWKGVQQPGPVSLPNMKAVQATSPRLQTLSVGPGLWYSMEQDMKQQQIFDPMWPALKRLILHLIVESMDLSMRLLTTLVKAIPTLTTLEVYVHKDSKVEVEEFHQLKHQFPALNLKCGSWKKGLKFECFSF